MLYSYTLCYFLGFPKYFKCYLQNKGEDLNHNVFILCSAFTITNLMWVIFWNHLWFLCCFFVVCDFILLSFLRIRPFFFIGHVMEMFSTMLLWKLLWFYSKDIYKLISCEFVLRNLLRFMFKTVFWILLRRVSWNVVPHL